MVLWFCVCLFSAFDCIADDEAAGAQAVVNQCLERLRHASSVWSSLLPVKAYWKAIGVCIVKSAFVALRLHFLLVFCFCRNAHTRSPLISARVSSQHRGILGWRLWHVAFAAHTHAHRRHCSPCAGAAGCERAGAASWTRDGVVSRHRTSTRVRVEPAAGGWPLVRRQRPTCCSLHGKGSDVTGGGHVRRYAQTACFSCKTTLLLLKVTFLQKKTVVHSIFAVLKCIMVHQGNTKFAFLAKNNSRIWVLSFFPSETKVFQ